MLARIGPDRALLELRRLGPGTHRVADADDAEETVTIAAGEGAWVRVRVLESDVPDGWVRAAAVANDYRTEVMHHVVGPCVEAVMEAQGIAVPTDDEAERDKIGTVLLETYLDAWRRIRPQVEGRARARRFAVYDLSRIICIEEALAGAG